MFKIDENYSDNYDDTDVVRYPGGKAINSSGVDTTDGTPWLAKMFNNTIGWMQALYIKAFGSLTGISGDAENAQISDVVRALDKIRGENNTAERTISENTYFKKTGGVISGNTSVEGQLHVKGDLIVDGTGEEIISTELKVGADTITLREGNPTGLASRELAGVVTRNYDGQGNNNIIAIDADGNARVGDIDIATRLLYSSDGNNFFEDENLTIAATIGQDEVVRDTGNTTSGGVKIYEGTTFSNNNTQPMATREEEANMTDGYGVTWNAQKKCLETTFIPSGAVIPQNIQADTTITGIVADKCVYITAANAITLTLANASQVGIKIRIINTTSLTHTLSLTSVSINVPHILPMANIEIMWNGTAWQHVGGCAVGTTFEQKPQCDSPFDVFPCSGWVELISHNSAFYRSANAPKTLYTLDAVTFYADVERLNPVDWSGIKNPDGTPGTVSNTGNTQYNSRGEEMKIYTGSWTSGNAASYVNKTDVLNAQEQKTAKNGLTFTGTSVTSTANNRGHAHTLNNGNTSSSGTVTTAGIRHSGNTGNVSGSGSSWNHEHALRLPIYGGDDFSTNITDARFSGDNYRRGEITTEGTTSSEDLQHTHPMPASYIYGTTDGESQNHTHSVTASGTIAGDAETRPVNYTIRIWKRIS